MAAENPKTPSWKHTAGTNRPPEKTSRKPWQPTQRTPASRTVDPRSRFRKRAAAAGIFGALLIAAMAVVFNFVSCHKPPAMLVVGPDVGPSLISPSNIYGANSVRAISEWANGDKNRARVATEDWLAALNKTNEQTIVLYFAAHGAADRDGPYLWMTPADAVNIDPAHKLHVKDILNRLRDPKLADRHKLLIFDATQVPASWAHGYLHNDFARALKGLDGQIGEVKNLAVICSTDEDQRSWISEELRRTIFGYFLEVGLKNGAGRNERVNAWNLFEYVSKEVTNWSRANRDADQTPILLPSKDREGIARKIELVAGTSEPVPPGSQPPEGFSLPPSLRSAWEQREALENQQPPPHTIAPDLWRAYLDTLLRWEYLVRAGADTVAVENRAKTLADQLSGSRLFESTPACAANALPASRALGLPTADASSAAFIDVWSPPADKRPDEMWRTIREANPDRVPALRLAAVDWLLNRLAEKDSPPNVANLRRAEDFLKAVEESNPRPVEAHYLRLLQRYQPEKLRVDLIVRALTMRREAERIAFLCGAEKDAYPYADQVQRWLQALIAAPDDARRQAEDLLFVGDESSIKIATGRMADAETAYGICVQHARSVSAALRLRDRVFGRLPYYARWLASYRGSMTAELIRAKIEEVERIAAGAHELTELLETVPPDPKPRLVEIASRSDVLAKAFDKLEQDFRKEVEGLSGTVVPANWHAIDSVLQVPFIDARRRGELLFMLRDISRSLLQGKQLQAGVARAQAANAQTAAEYQGRLALALLGERWVEEIVRESIAPPSALPFTYGELKDRIIRPRQGAWWESYREAGEQIGWLWRLMPASIDFNLGKATREEIKSVDKYLANASRLCRMHDSAAPLSAGRRPIEDERRYWMHELLLWQAKRTVQDGWAALEPGPTVTPYCVEAGRRYLEAAQNLILRLGGSQSFEAREKARRLARVTETEALVKAPAFNPEWRKTRDLTDRSKPWEIEYQITQVPSPAHSVGYPSLRYVAPEGPIRHLNTPNDRRLAITSLASGQTASAPKKEDYIFTGSGDSASGVVEVDLFYRGHIYPMKTQVALTGRAQIEWDYVPPTGPGRFAVLADPELKRGAVTLLVDRTLSMSEPIDVVDAKGKGATSTKIIEAVAALKDLINRLEPNTVLSIGVFHGDANREVQLEWLLAPQLFTGQAAEREKLIALANQINYHKEGKSTPLARMIFDKVLQKDELERAFPKNFTGFRSVIVLTDGEDTVSNDPGQIVRRGLLDCRFDVALHMLFFALNDKADRIAREQFKPIEDEEEFVQNYRTPGKVWSIKNRKDLADKLLESMLPKIRYLPTSKNIERLQSLPVTLITDRTKVETPPLNAGVYDLRATLTDKRHYLRVERGDRLLLQLVDTPEGLAFRLPPFAQLTGKTSLPSASDSQKRASLTLAYNSLTSYAGSYDLEMYAAVEKLAEGRSGDLRMVRPRFVWFEAEATGAAKKNPTFMRIENMADRVAPAWKVRCGPWPAVAGKNILDEPASPRLNAWWIDEYPNEDHGFNFSQAGRAKLEFTDRQKSFTIQGKTVTIENVEIENESLKVEVKDLDGLKVVARIEWLDANTLRAAPGERHQFFTEKNRYTARFGPLDKDDLQRPVRIRFFDLDKLKGKGGSGTQTYEMELLARPPHQEGQDKDDILYKMGLK